ncbi:ribbon-helix-helix domain-containing protein [Halococcus saccharolyticus]|uniref:Ribbon-helix-helix protein CopG domain-containing protein n=1 Tax=Halococcus saccharolyticus DSM 5350 TaxID=1227455 RepID=M0MU21_9EURY|nr:ribbon-helix-helix domain-containing protein [Halococcus saccharolyticus]EMA47950.1 hypothetical protein C449_00720 [Halococcus saccharolyticus DSM 5350]
MTDNTVRVTISMDEDLDKEIEDQLDYGDNKSEFIRNALRKELDGECGSEGNPKAATGMAAD